ncbi:MFS transporter [Nocardia jiangsuensis]|uniref:MFS transporter n=1 Tax=Nocardia jiangsuensis TaxID=1691563 RepID=A0ABV8E1V0_9NOCA
MSGPSGRERRIVTALFAAGLTTFASMYSAQALLPSLAAAFGVAPAQAALAVSLTTGFLALAIIPVSALSGRFGRTRVMVWSAAVSAGIGLLLPLAPTLDVLLAARAVQGITLAGVPAVAMAYLAEEIDAGRLGAAMGVYVSGTTLGGLTGRLIPAFALDHTSWRWAQALIAVVGALCTVWFVRVLPASRGFRPSTTGLWRELLAQCRRPQLLALFALAFVLMGGFVSVYNYLGFRLLAEPFGLPASVAGLVFVLYLAGTVASTTAGRLADRFGRGPVLVGSVVLTAVGAALSLPDRLPLVLVGILLFTAGFFGAHAVASAWVGVAAVGGNRAAASSLYLFCYYLGSAVLGGLSGLAFAGFGWAGLVGGVGVLLVLAGGAVVVVVRGERVGPGVEVELAGAGR